MFLLDFNHNFFLTIISLHVNKFVCFFLADYPTATNPTYPLLKPPRIAASVKENKFQIVHTGSTVRYHCSGRSSDNVRDIVFFYKTLLSKAYILHWMNVYDYRHLLVSDGKKKVEDYQIAA